jgi:hypothetical protein
VVLAVACALSPASAAARSAASDGVAGGAARFADVTVAPGRPGALVGPRFLGLSFEASAISTIGRDASAGNLLALLKSVGTGVLRFGGASLDSSPAVSGPGGRSTDHVTVFTSAELTRLRRLLNRSGWTAMIGVPLGRYDPTNAAREAATASQRLGPTLAAVEVGNEPNTYWLSGLRPPSWGYPQYQHEITSYRRAIAAAAPGVPIAGPDTTMSDPPGPLAKFDGFTWLSAYAAHERPAILTPHLYPLDGCGSPEPTLADLLSARVANLQDRLLNRMAAIARAHRITLRLGETNNVGCGGRPGVSNTFGAALWALRYMLSVARAGFAGINFHTLPNSCSGYSPLCSPSPADLAEGRLRTMPEWYALRLFHPLVGERLIPSRVFGASPNLTVSALASGTGVDLVIVNSAASETAPSRVRLRAPDRFVQRVLLRLTAPALGATSGVQLTSVISPEPRTQGRHLTPGHTEFEVSVPIGSALLLRLERSRR